MFKKAHVAIKTNAEEFVNKQSIKHALRYQSQNIKSYFKTRLHSLESHSWPAFNRGVKSICNIVPTAKNITTPHFVFTLIGIQKAEINDQKINMEI